MKLSKKNLKRDLFGEGLSKIEIAKIQINTAIKMLFSEADPISIYTVLAAGYEIVRHLAKKKNTEEYLRFMDHIKKGKEGEFWSYVNKPVNFFKHANKDPEAIFGGIDVRAIDHTLFHSLSFLVSLNESKTKEMELFLAMYMCMYPDILQDGDFKTNFEKGLKLNNIEQFSRKEMLGMGNAILAANK